MAGTAQVEQWYEVRLRLVDGTGTDLTVSPAYGSLREDLGKAAAGLALPTIASPSPRLLPCTSADHRRYSCS